MAKLLYKVMTPYALTINTNSLDPALPTSYVVQPGHTFVGDDTDAALLSLIDSGAVLASPVTIEAPLSTALLPVGESNGVAGLDASGSLPISQATKMGNFATYARNSSGSLSMLDPEETSRVVMILVVVTTAFANGDGAQPQFSFGQTGSASKFGATSLLTNATLGTRIVMGGELSTGCDLLVTATAATGTTSTGAISVTVIATPEVPGIG